MRAHLIGICGTAMAGIALMLKETGLDVQGSDSNAYPPMSTLLDSHGIPVMKGYISENLRSPPDFVVVGNVARSDNPEVLEAVARGIPMYSMPQTIRRFFLEDKVSLTIAGTHGKTTVTSMAAWLLYHGGLEPSYLVGGIPLNFGRNFRLGQGRHFVIEGDEYDTAFFDKKAKFFHYKPTCAVITSLEYDHADIYPDLESLVSTFIEFAGTIDKKGLLIYCADYPLLSSVVEYCPAKTVSYGFSASADLRIEDMEPGPDGTSFVLVEGERRHSVKLEMWGRHNVLNAVAAMTLARQVGLSCRTVLEGLGEFKGTMRRFQVVGAEDGITVLDDFAHHPTAVRETIAAARTRFPESRIFAAYHFESNTSRRKVFEADYAASFRGADHVFLTHPLKKNDDLGAQEYLDPGVVTAGVQEYAQSARAFPDMDDMADTMVPMLEPGDVVLGMSGRDFTPFYEALLERLRTRSSAAGARSTAAGLPAY